MSFLMIKVLTTRLTNDIVSIEQLGPVLQKFNAEIPFTPSYLELQIRKVSR